MGSRSFKLRYLEVLWVDVVREERRDLIQEEVEEDSLPRLKEVEDEECQHKRRQTDERDEVHDLKGRQHHQDKEEATPEAQEVVEVVEDEACQPGEEEDGEVIPARSLEGLALHLVT